MRPGRFRSRPGLHDAPETGSWGGLHEVLLKPRVWRHEERRRSMEPAGNGNPLARRGIPRLENASSVARCIRLAREGQSEALSQILEAYRNYLRLIASTCFERQLRGKADPSDVVQDALVKVHENFHQFRGATEG